jgi:hypothetical protein
MPGGFRESLGEIRSATDLLIRAASQIDPQGIHDAIDARGEALRRFTDLMESRGNELPDPERQWIRSEYRSLCEQSAEAERSLSELAKHCREAGRNLAKGARAVRTYHREACGDPIALDRSG